MQEHYPFAGCDHAAEDVCRDEKVQTGASDHQLRNLPGGGGPEKWRYFFFIGHKRHVGYGSVYQPYHGRDSEAYG